MQVTQISVRPGPPAQQRDVELPRETKETKHKHRHHERAQDGDGLIGRCCTQHASSRLVSNHELRINLLPQRLYACAELAQHLIRAYAKSRSWNLEVWPGKVKLPSDILRPLPSAEAVNQVCDG